MAQRKNMGRMFHVKQRRKSMGERGYFLRAVYKTKKKGYNSKKEKPSGRRCGRRYDL